MVAATRPCLIFLSKPVGKLRSFRNAQPVDHRIHLICWDYLVSGAAACKPHP